MRYIFSIIAAMRPVGFMRSSFASHAHYTSGAEGLKAATLPPEGLYYRLYVYYQASHMRDNDGNKVGDFDADVYVMARRFIYNSGFKLLGADLVVDILLAWRTLGHGGRLRGIFTHRRFQ